MAMRQMLTIAGLAAVPILLEEGEVSGNGTSEWKTGGLRVSLSVHDSHYMERLLRFHSEYRAEREPHACQAWR